VDDRRELPAVSENGVAAEGNSSGRTTEMTTRDAAR
jgi:hypothetical protein